MESLPIEIDVRGVRGLMDAGQDFVLLDCRRHEEHQFAKIPGNILIPMEQVPQRSGELDELKRIVVYCHLGARSLMVTEWLRANGFSQAQSMAGGIDAWSDLIDASIPRYQ